MIKQPTLTEMQHAVETRGKHTEAPYLWRDVCDDPFALWDAHFWPLQERESEVSDE